MQTTFQPPFPVAEAKVAGGHVTFVFPHPRATLPNQSLTQTATRCERGTIRGAHFSRKPIANRAPSAESDITAMTIVSVESSHPAHQIGTAIALPLSVLA
ncbi:hypothetical protein RRSWK_00475 [Rhodopirellula sp. SWK7]|nr:hypothetical protein RRSWK_00475 [Rhodopirellula sp. SWK7]